MNRTILCIDDEPQILMLYRMVLEEYGYGVLIEANGWDGLGASDRCPVDCILLDYQMPGMNGAEFVQHLTDRHCSTPVILISGSRDIPPQLLNQVEAFIEKPWRAQQLLECVENVTRNAERHLTRPPLSIAQAAANS
ncbi:MAG: response regulator [Terriglobales bacterium]|jgi:response regulator RpfG family c-di-GMP phosphodiesterase